MHVVMETGCGAISNPRFIMIECKGGEWMSESTDKETKNRVKMQGYLV